MREGADDTGSRVEVREGKRERGWVGVKRKGEKCEGELIKKEVEGNLREVNEGEKERESK